MFPATGAITPLDFLTKASFEPAPAVLVVLGVAWYLRAVGQLEAKGRPWPAVRKASWCFGWLLVLVATQSGMNAFDHTNFTIHVVQHIMVGMVGPIFLAFAAPLTLAVQAGQPRTQIAVVRALRSPIGRNLTYPAVSWAVYGGSMFVLYFSGLYPIALRHSYLYQLVDLELLIAGCIFFVPVVAVDPLSKPMSYAKRIAYLILLLPFHTIVGMSLESQSTRIANGVSLISLHTGGGVLWFSGEAVGLLGTIAVFVLWLKADERSAIQHDLVSGEVAERQLSHWRATREAAARAISAR